MVALTTALRAIGKMRSRADNDEIGTESGGRLPTSALWSRRWVVPVWVGSAAVAVKSAQGTARDRVAALLAGVESSGSFSARASVPAEELSMEVRGVGGLKLPVSAQQAKQLIAVARPAKYGLGEQTLLDQRVRDTWEIPKSRVKIDNRRWKAALRPALERLRGDLGLPDGCRLKPEFHSMLVYAPGQHFAPHQDSEKSDGMVASLVVTLPGSAKGGSLVVGHGAERATYRGSRDRISLVAFYADCRHEIRPVRTGFRVVLTYNLILVGDSTGQTSTMAEEAVEEVAECLHEHFSTPVSAPSWRRDPGPLDPPDRLVYLLDHEYTARALGWARLKGPDADHAAAIRAAAQRADCEVVLALAEVHETWSAFESDYDPRWGRYPHRSPRADDDGSNDDETRCEGPGDGEYDLDELIESEIGLVHWIYESGGTGEAISTSVDDAEVCASTPTSKLTPYESDYEPYMGNYGNTLDRWYRRAAIVVWPRERAFIVRAQGSPGWALDQITAQLDAGEIASARELARHLEPFWDALSHRRVGATFWPERYMSQSASMTRRLRRSFSCRSRWRPSRSTTHQRSRPCADSMANRGGVRSLPGGRSTGAGEGPKVPTGSGSSPRLSVVSLRRTPEARRRRGWWSMTCGNGSRIPLPGE